jgi:hypothetical protein
MGLAGPHGRGLSLLAWCRSNGNSGGWRQISQVQILPLLAVHPWAGPLTSLSLCFPIYKWK